VKIAIIIDVTVLLSTYKLVVFRAFTIELQFVYDLEFIVFILAIIA
jgi:hypothetical protein